MQLLKWDQIGEHNFEAGVDHGVLYQYDKAQNKFVDGVAWNGLTTVTESPSGAEANDQYADNIKYLSLRSAENFGGTIEAFTYPDEFEQNDGTATPIKGVKVTQQNRKAFGFSYRTLLGNDVDGTDAGYQLHLVYMATANPSEKSRSTINDSPEAATLSWEFTTTPVEVGTYNDVAYKPTAHIVVKSTDFVTEDEKATLATFEEIIYGKAADATAGTPEVAARLPLPQEVFELLNVPEPGPEPTPTTPSVTLDKSTASITVNGTETLAATTVPADAEVTWTSSDENVATVEDGVVTGVAAGDATITASITVDGQSYTDTCAVTVSAG